MSSEKPEEPGRIRLVSLMILATLLWSATAAVSLSWNERELRRTLIEAARIQARASFEKDVLYRRWNAMAGGVYAPITASLQPNLHLKVPEREISTLAGKALTLVNPAYMTRLVHEMERSETGVRAHITSLKLLRPENRADPWEREALEAFEAGQSEVSSVEVFEGARMLRLMRPLFIEAPCLKCHGAQGYTLGDVRGGISESVPLSPLERASADHRMALRLGHLAVWGLGIFFIFLAAAALRRRIGERDAALAARTVALEQMQEAYDQVKTLHGILPICMHCRKIRSDAGSWDPLEDYVAEHTETTYSHGLCPSCMAEHYSDE